MKNLRLSTVLFLLALSFAPLAAFAAMSNSIQVRYDNGSFALKQSDSIQVRVLAANTAETVTSSSFTDSSGTTKYANYVVFSSTCDFYMDTDAAATVPSSDITDGSGPELNPTVRYMAGDDQFSLITDASSCVVTMMFYR